MTIIEALEALKAGKRIKVTGKEAGEKMLPLRLRPTEKPPVLYCRNGKIMAEGVGEIIFAFEDLNKDVYEIYEESILDEGEREYLSVFLRPFRGRIISLEKIPTEKSGFEKIEMTVRSKNPCLAFEVACLPCFEKGTMYERMELGREYKVEELRLFGKETGE